MPLCCPFSFLPSHIPFSGKGSWGKDNSGVGGLPSIVIHTFSRWVSCFTCWRSVNSDFSCVAPQSMFSTSQELLCFCQEWSGAVKDCVGLISSCHHGGVPSDLRLQGGHLPPEGHVRRQLPAPASHSVRLHLPASSSGLSQDRDLQLSRSAGPWQQVCPTQRWRELILHHAARADQAELHAESHV